MREGLGPRLEEVWEAQAADGFLLGDPHEAVETRTALDPTTGVEFRFHWLPHREVRGDPAALVRLGILDPGCEADGRFVDPGDPAASVCYLCPPVMRRCFPSEVLVPFDAGDRRWWAGANFAWLSRNHYTVVSDDHVPQDYDRDLLEAMLDIHRLTAGGFRVIFNGARAGASIPWHLHLQITSEPFPIETLKPEAAGRYPLPVRRFDRPDDADGTIAGWLESDPAHHRVNLLVAGPEGAAGVFVALRDTRRPNAARKGLMGGYEAAGAFAYSEPRYRAAFEAADLAAIEQAFADITPDAAAGYFG
jgi:hypothetical protein